MTKANMTKDAKVQEQYERYIYARDNGHTKFLTKAAQCDAFYYGDQWEEAIKQRLIQQRRPALTLNKTLPSISAIQGQQLSNRADVSYRPSMDGTEEVARVLDKLWLYTATVNKLDWLESEVFTDGIITSRGFFDVRLGFDDNIYGDISIKQLNPYNVLIDPDAEEYDPASWKEVWLTKWFSLDDIENTYGKAARMELAGKTQSSYEMGYDFIDMRYGSFGGSARRVADDSPAAAHRRRFRVLERQHRVRSNRPHFVDMVTGETRLIPEHWDNEKISNALKQFDLNVITRPYSCVDWTVTIDNVLVHDEVSPYKYFTPVPYFPLFRHGTTLGLVENMISPQELYNKTKSQELHVINSTANGGWQMEEGQLMNMTDEDLEQRGAETGLVISRKPGTEPLTKIQPNQIPSGLDRIGFQAAEDLKEISMASDSLRGFDRADVAAKAILTKQATGASNFAMPMENLQRTRALLAERVLYLQQNFLTEERTYAITGNDLAAPSEQVVINQVTPAGQIVNDLTIGEYAVVVTTVPARTTFEETQFQQAKELRELGIPIPDDVLIENSNLQRKAEIAKRVKERSGEGDPSEAQQRVQELEMQIKEIEARKLDAEAKKIEAEAVLALVRAQKLADESEGNATTELNKLIAENERIRRESEDRREATDKELTYKYAELEHRKAEHAYKAQQDTTGDK